MSEIFAECWQNNPKDFTEELKPYINKFTMENIKILVVDDDLKIGQLFVRLLKKQGAKVVAVGSVAEANDCLRRQDFDLAFVDLYLPDGNGIDLLSSIKQKAPAMPVVVITGYGTIERAVEAMKAGAFDFLLKPFKHIEVIPMIIDKALQQQKLLTENLDLKHQLSAQYQLDRLVGKSKAMQDIFRIVRQLSNNESTVLIHGESGTGKELLARAIHFNSPRRLQKFVPVDCGSLPETLIESELFGHLKGAFTDAYRDVKGLFREADHGTIFLDEIGELPLSVQAKLLRVLQERQVRPLGSTTPVSVDVRVIAASKRDLKQMVSLGQFREDLFYRLNVVYLELPPLRERMEDVPLLVEHFLKEASKRTGKSYTITPEALELIMKYHWPGNVRELENCIEQAIALFPGAELKPEHLNITNLVPPVAPIPEEVPLSFDAYEKLAIERALRESKNVIPEAAKKLKVGLSTLYRKMKKLGISY